MRRSGVRFPEAAPTVSLVREAFLRLHLEIRIQVSPFDHFVPPKCPEMTYASGVRSHALSAAC